MINATSSDVVVHVPVTQVTIRWQGAERKVFQMGQGFAHAEYNDSNVHAISNPLEDWLRTSAGGIEQVDPMSNVYFTFEQEGERGNPGLDDKSRSLTDLQVPLS